MIKILIFYFKTFIHTNYIFNGAELNPCHFSILNYTPSLGMSHISNRINRVPDIFFRRRKLIKSKQHYPIHNKELLAI